MTFFEKNLGGKGKKKVEQKLLDTYSSFLSWRFLINGPSLKFSRNCKPLVPKSFFIQGFAMFRGLKIGHSQQANTKRSLHTNICQKINENQGSQKNVV